MEVAALQVHRAPVHKPAPEEWEERNVLPNEGIVGGLGLLLAIGIVHNRVMDASFMPWAIASQTIPILAIAPMIIVVMNSVGITGLVPKAIISAWAPAR